MAQSKQGIERVCEWLAKGMRMPTALEKPGPAAKGRLYATQGLGGLGKKPDLARGGPRPTEKTAMNASHTPKVASGKIL